MRVPMLVVAMIATPFLASVSYAQHSERGGRHSEEHQKGQHGEKRHADKDKCEKQSAKGEQDQQGQHEDNDGSSCVTPAVTPPVTPPPAASGVGEIHGVVFNDLNGNGVQDYGEPALVGFTVTLSGPVAQSSTTDANGNYSFTALPLGSFVVCPAGGHAEVSPASGPACGALFGYSLDVPSFMPNIYYGGIDFALK